MPKILTDTSANFQQALQLCSENIRLEQVIKDVIACWGARYGFSVQTLDKWSLLLGRFNSFCEKQDIKFLHELDVEIVESFVMSKGKDRRQDVSFPTISTISSRKACLNAFFKTCIQLNIPIDNFTNQIVLPLRKWDRDSSVRVFLSEKEVEQLRFYAFSNNGRRVTACVVGLLLSGVRSSEVGWITGNSIDFGKKTVTVTHGSKRFSGRTIPIGDVLIRDVKQRLEYLKGDYSIPLGVNTLNSSIARRQASVGETVKRVLKEAKLFDYSFTANSLTCYAGRKCFEETNRIESVAKLLGMRSLQEAASFIGYNWQSFN